MTDLWVKQKDGWMMLQHSRQNKAKVQNSFFFLSAIFIYFIISLRHLKDGMLRQKILYLGEIPLERTLKFDNSDMFTCKCQRGVFWQLLLFLQKQKHSLYCVNLTGTAFSCFLSPQQKNKNNNLQKKTKNMTICSQATISEMTRNPAKTSVWNRSCFVCCWFKMVY